MNPLRLAIADTKYARGVRSLEEDAPAMTVRPLEEAFQVSWPTDAHFVQYMPVRAGEPFPRLTKPVLHKLRAMGADVEVNLFAFDYDTPGHQAWTPESLAAFWSLLASAASRWPLADQWSLLYTTAKGARLVYILDEPVVAEEAEGKIRWMCEQFCLAGLPVDRLCDWTRLFRLPYVLRDEKKSWEDPHFNFIPRFGVRLHAASLPVIEKAKSTAYGEFAAFEDDRPDEEEAAVLLEAYDARTGRMTKTPFYKAARKALTGRDCFATVFNGAPIASTGQRDATIHKYVGQIASICWGIEGFSPSHIYAMLLPSVRQLVPDDQTPDWSLCLWDHISRIWPKEQAKIREEEKVEEAQAQSDLGLLDTLVERMKEWNPSEYLHKHGQDVAREYIRRHVIVSCKGKFFVMRRDGLYDPMQLCGGEVIARLRILGMDAIVDTKRPSANTKGFTDVSLTELLNHHSTIVSSIQSQPQIPGGVIVNPDIASSVLRLPSYRRNPKLQPEFNRDVDEWLVKLFADRYLEMCEWISWALAFEEGPICAVSIKGNPGVGKKMLVRGLAETLEYPEVASASDLVGQYQYGLARSPFLVIDEGWPTTFSYRHPADHFRALVGGEPFQCNMRYEAPVTVFNPVRCVFTANNKDVVGMLAANKDLSPEDRDALGVRLKHFDVTDEASIWLSQKGGLAFTGKPGRRWIAGDGSGVSDFIVAKHFLWLYSQRVRPVRAEGSRFLVEGDKNHELMFELRTMGGATPLVIETIIKLLNLPAEREGVVVQDNRLFILASEILDFHRASGSVRERLTINTIARVLASLIVRDWPDPMVLASRPQVGRRRWHELDPETLLAAAEREGRQCAKLDRLCAAREEARKNLKLDPRLGAELKPRYDPRLPRS